MKYTAWLVRCSTIELSKPLKIHGPSRRNYHIPPLQCFCHLRNTQQTHVSPVRTLWFNKFLIKNGYSTKGNRKERKIEINNILHDEGKFVNVWKILKWFLKGNTDLYFSYLHPCTGTWIRRTRGLKIGFNKEVEIVYLCFILLKPV